ncbi:restriction endonuclease [Bifidobacterium avesanii]|uniref:Restriction endonuclease n=1 Tax=Bifidobacterium avesanii TaxID=1798157 RepID=A0A7K3TGM5_9BIFI|nr:restriction endonuclease [Bifidobacterium avesanii]
MNSVGLAAVEVDSDGMPTRLLNAQSVIHDGGVDPTKNKEAITRKNLSGIGRRARRMVRRKRRRLADLDALLQRQKYPIVDPGEFSSSIEPWVARADLADHFVIDNTERKRKLSIALRHIARHRGWRNPYHRVDSLLIDNEYSDQYEELRSRVEKHVQRTVPDGLTPAQLVMRAVALGGATQRLRTSTTRGVGILPEKLMQEDNANELKRIFTMQRIPREQWEPLFRLVFAAVSPRGSAEERVGKDPLDPTQQRALKASLAFQRYRIVNMITNLRIAENDRQRPLTIAEKNDVFDMLSADSMQDLNWVDVADLLGVRRSQLRGVGSMTEDGEERVTNTPPRLVSVQRLHEADRKIAKPLIAWWRSASDDAKEAMIRLLSNTVDVDKVSEDPRYMEVIAFFDTLDEDGLAKLDSVDLPSGRAAYSVKTLECLTRRMLTTDDDLHAARKAIFHVSDYWHPPVDPIAAPLGNPSVDRVAKIVGRWLKNCEDRWGMPKSVQIEHVRSGFDSVATARQYERRTGSRSEYRRAAADRLHNEEHLDRIRDSDIRRLEAIQRQNGECLYCGRAIAFRACEMDHIVPRKGVGSTNTRTNLAAVCITCNRAKSKLPFAVWAATDAAQALGVSMKDTLERVRYFNRDARLYDASSWRGFKQAVITRLKQTEEDDPIDSRSIESVAWMADELHQRIDWHYNATRYQSDDRNLPADRKVSVCVFRGRVTAAARRASGIEGAVRFFGPHMKTRLDRRHHAVDAAVIAMMQTGVAQILMERESLRESQRLIGRLAPDERPWREYPYEKTASYDTFMHWHDIMVRLLDLLNDALDHDRIVVRQPMRLSLGNSIAHDATVKSLVKVRVGNALDADVIRRASTPALWCALTRLPDYDEKTGLPEDDARVIMVHGIRYGSNDEIEVFAGQSAQIAVRGGSSDIGSAMHHARIYRCWKANAKGERKYWYGMIRVFQTDLLRARYDDLFTVPLPPQSISMRYGEPRTVAAVQSGKAEYLGWLCVGDEIRIDVGRVPGKGQIGEFAKWCAGLDQRNAAVESWVVDGLFAPAKLRLHPRIIAAEGLSKIEDISAVPDGAGKVIGGAGWLPSIDSLAGTHPVVIRRNTIGEQRWHSKSGLPCSWRWTN